MVDTFEKAVTVTRKEPLLWSLYAFCLEKIGERDKAIKVMERGLKKLKVTSAWRRTWRPSGTGGR